MPLAASAPGCASTSMAESTKYMPINGGTLISDLKLRKIFSFRTKRTKAFASVFISVFIGFSVFLAFNPSSNPSSPWFSNIFSSDSISFRANITRGSSSSSSTSSSGGNGCVRSQFSCIYTYLFPSNSSHPQNSTSISTHPQNSTSVSTHPQNSTSTPLSSSTTNSTSSRSQDISIGAPQGLIAKNQTQDKKLSDKDEILKQNRTGIGSQSSSNVSNSSQPHKSTDTPKSTDNGVNTAPETPKSAVPVSSKNGTANGTDKKIEEKSMAKNSSSSLVKKQGSNATNSGVSAEQTIEDLVKNLVNCNLFDGNWVKDESYPLYKPGSCSLIDEQFNCFLNGRPDKGFQMLKWKPKGCTLPRLDGGHMLQLLRGKRLVFVGDSLNRNMWESLVCILRNSVKDQKKVYEASGRHHFRSEASYSFVFEDYNFTVEFFVTPFLVQEWEMKDKNGTKKETLRLDLVSNSAPQYKDADIIIFNTGHWWTHDKTAKGQDYYQEGSHVYGDLNVLEAFRKAMTTWGRWVDANINPSRTLVFFRGYSASHFSGGRWNSGGACDSETEPIKNTTYLTPYPDKMIVMEKVLKNMKVHVSYLNITRLTDFRKDGHPSIYRKQHYTEEERRSPLHFQDCSHWCLPGVPDSWNEILYAELLAKQYQNLQHKR